ncbi:NADPH:quinone reductase [Nocardia donostiensis]|uniref:zinc-binding dehydrogenase n=1 Tax=Nocardia donostiensis TaxID=1538463 RepID=UPI0009D92352|nr:zinc-binding dehydrogenase [Nocardia donostiensis]OQS16804.1 NADPH:quinone reductase [Nocardia donostiensis]
MRVVQATAFGGPEVLEVRELPDPAPGADEVLVEVAAADVMFLDTKLRSGWGIDFFPVQPPYVPGGAVAGTVGEVGANVDPSWLGKRVMTNTAASGIGGGVPTGGYAEKALAKAESLTEVPDTVTSQQAVALVHDGRTSLAVFDRAAIQPGEWVLITAAGGGLGTLLTQYAHHAGAKVIAAARGESKLELAARLGADSVVDYSQSGWADQAYAATGGSGPHVVLDGAGGALGAAALSITANGGRFLGYGTAAGSFATDIDVEPVRDVQVIGLFDLQDGATDWQLFARRALAEVAAGRLETVVGQSYPLAEAAQAHAAIEARAAVGRTVLMV